MIRAQQINKHFGELHVLRGVDIDVAKGEVVAIVGPSGAGKTSLLHILGTLSAADPTPTSELRIAGLNLHGLSDKALAAFRNTKIGFIFQFHQLLPEFTALENVCIPAFIARRTKLDAETKAKELLDYLGLKERYHHKPNELSGGEQQRVAVARALINNPELILADEPSGNLDTGSAQKLHELFFELRDQFGQTFVIVTHNTELAAMADRTLSMQDGRIVS
ncbi:MAG: ABC transporter ATP-binding protein [Bacteroidetes bacterium]|nr:ABC transporter ATP-binding protein [Bacteroidota bacterium]MDA0879126.1 ABC transporter ATP-binding protein [Bacteroidota bacterium]MDA1115590.1 ABC transporter ATP-binding protein [Bacteroidota bacterium]